MATYPLCGNCGKTHDTEAQVRACYEGLDAPEENVFVTPPPTSAGTICGHCGAFYATVAEVVACYEGSAAEPGPAVAQAGGVPVLLAPQRGADDPLPGTGKKAK
jgi:hypothetical protein